MMNSKRIGISNNLLVIFLALSFIVFFTISIMEIFHINKTRSDTKLEEQAYIQNQNKLLQLRELSKKEDEFRLNIYKMNQLIPDQPNEAQIIHQIQSMSFSSSVDFVKVELAERVVNNSIGVMPITLSFRGDYYGLIELINNISDGERLIRIDGINIVKSQEPSQINNTEGASQSDASETDSQSDTSETASKFITVDINARAFFRQK